MESPSIVTEPTDAAQAQDDGAACNPYVTARRVPPGHYERLQAAVERYHDLGIAVVPIGLGRKSQNEADGTCGTMPPGSSRRGTTSVS